MSSHLAIDLGAESGRMVIGRVDKGRLTLEERHRFPNRMMWLQSHWRWNVYSIYEEILTGLCACAADGIEFSSMGVDSWGVDFGLLAEDGSLLGLPVTYRDDRTEGMMERFFEHVPAETVYQKTGIQFMRLNSLYQLFSMSQNESPLRQHASDVLFIPDFFHYLLSGSKATEFSFATTTQMYNLDHDGWDTDLVAAANFDAGLLQEVCETGTVLGTLTPDLQRETGLGSIDVIAAGTHDTASAVAAVPAVGDEWAYISSGTWSLMGIEVTEPIRTDAARKLNFTNEGGVGKRYRFLKNIMGLWLVQRLRDDFGQQYSYEELGHFASSAEPFATLVNPDYDGFYNPDSMKKTFDEYCVQRDQPTPLTPGAYVRAALESLALRYRNVLDELRSLHPRPINTIHIVGGGSQNSLLCQFTADALGLPVIAGPAEATAIGNVLVQAQAQGHVQSLEEARKIVSVSFDPTRYEPRKPKGWDAAYDRFCELP